MMKKINARKLKDEVNLVLYELKGIGIQQLSLSNKLCDLVVDSINKIVEEQEPKQKQIKQITL